MIFTMPEACARLEKVRIEHHGIRAVSALEEPAIVGAKPWLAHAFESLLRLQEIGRFEPGVGDFRISDSTVNTVGRILGSIRYRSLPTPTVGALPGGGIQLHWSSGTEALEVNVFPEEGVGIAKLRNDDPVQITELSATEYSRLNDFLAELMS